MLSTLSLFLLGPKKTRADSTPPVEKDDDILPLHVLDDTAGNRSLLLAWTMRFDDVLDANMLHRTLVRLLQMEGWSKLGGRLRLNKSGKLEVHVPREFTNERPAVGFSQVVHSMSIESHPLASQLPRQTPYASVQSGSDRFLSLAMSSDAPSKLSDFLDIKRDVPQLSVHVVSFSDSTLVTLSWLHLTADGMGIKSLMEGWCKMLAGREKEIPPFVGYRHDPLEEALAGPMIKEPAREPWLLQNFVLSKLGFLLFVIRFLWEFLFGPKPDSRMLFLPATTMARLRDHAEEDLQAGEPGAPTALNVAEKKTSTYFISDNDILTGFLVKKACAGKAPTSGRGVTVVSMFEFRHRLPRIFDPASAYVANYMSQVWTLLTLREIADLPLGQLAARVRATLLAQTTEAQTLAQIRVEREGMLDSGRVPIAGKAGCWLVTFSNWSKMKFYDVDFSPAVVLTTNTNRRSGRPVYFHSIPLSHSLPVRNTLNIMGKDALGNYWVMGILTELAWKEIEVDLARLEVSRTASRTLLGHSN